MLKKRVLRFFAVFVLVLGAGPLVAPTAQAAPDCRGATGIVQCWDERVRECISNLRYPPSPC
jgi:hypothetical protein